MKDEIDIVPFPTQKLQDWLYHNKIDITKFAKQHNIPVANLYVWMRHESHPNPIQWYRLQKATNYLFELKDFVNLQYFPCKK
jgi:hypothetical protein